MITYPSGHAKIDFLFSYASYSVTVASKSPRRTLCPDVIDQIMIRLPADACARLCMTTRAYLARLGDLNAARSEYAALRCYGKMFKRSIDNHDHQWMMYFRLFISNDYSNNNMPCDCYNGIACKCRRLDHPDMLKYYHDDYIRYAAARCSVLEFSTFVLD